MFARKIYSNSITMKHIYLSFSITIGITIKVGIIIPTFFVKNQPFHRLFGSDSQPKAASCRPVHLPASTPAAPSLTLAAFSTHIIAAASYNTAKNYNTAIRSFTLFNQGKPVALDTITPDFIAQYEQWLRARRINLNTISCYMRSLRSLYNRAVEAGLVTTTEPFRRAFTGSVKTEKRAISKADIQRIADLPILSDSPLALTRDVFLFSVYCLGMPFIDIAHLQHAQIKDGHITYYRHKTGQRVNVSIEPCIQRLIERYRRPDSQLVFPILDASPTHTPTPEIYHQCLNTYNHHLKTLARLAGIDTPLTSYVARHTWATIAFSNDVSLPVISKALGHTNPNTTLVYIREINDQRLDLANKRILKEFLG